MGAEARDLDVEPLVELGDREEDGGGLTQTLARGELGENHGDPVAG